MRIRSTSRRKLGLGKTTISFLKSRYILLIIILIIFIPYSFLHYVRILYNLKDHDSSRVEWTKQENGNIIKWYWHCYKHLYTTTANPFSPAILIAQYTGPDAAYMEFADMTEKVNRAYARRRHYDYVRMNGVAFGDFAGYNKAEVLRTAIKMSIYDAVLILDADAAIVDMDQDIMELLPTEMMLTAHRVRKEDPSHTYNINNGVTLWNLHHAKISDVTTSWLSEIDKRVENGAFSSDQELLHKVLMTYSEEERTHMINGISTRHLFYQEGTFVKHVIRNNGGTWASPPEDLKRRKRILQNAVNNACEKWKGVCNDL